MDSLNINIVDIVILGIVAATAIIAFVRGFVREVLGTGSWIGAAIITILLLPYVQPFVFSQLESQIGSYLVAGGGLFLASLVILWTITHILSTRVQASPMGALDRTLGLIVGMVKGAFYVTILFVLMSWLVPGWTDRTWAKESRLLPLAAVGASWISQAIADRAKDEGKDIKDIKTLLKKDGAGYGDAAREEMNKLVKQSTQQQ